MVLDAAVKAGAPEGIIGWIDVPSLELTTQLMRDSDLILATGGPGMVKSAYSSGKPALGVGPGNTPSSSTTPPTSRWLSAPSSTPRPSTTA